MKGLSSASLGIPLAKFKSEYKNDHLSLVAQIPELSLHQSSSFYKNAKVILMGHETEGEWLKAHDFSARLGFSDAGLQWEKASATCENAKIAWSSAGSLDRERKLKGWVMADFPLVKKLRWDLQGQALEPEFNAALLNLKKLGNRPIDDVILGLSKAGQFKQATAKEVPEQSEIGRFSRSVLEKAKGIIDLSSPANAEEKQPPAPVASETSLNAVPESQDQEKPEDETPENTSEK